MLAFALLLALVLPTSTRAETSVRYDNVVVVAIGVSDYPDEPLPNAARDVRRFADLFRGSARLIELYDAQATRGAIIRAIREDAATAIDTPGERNLLIVYFVGHGRTVDGVGFLAPHGAQGEDHWLPLSRLRDIARQSKTFRHQLYILGSCFGGDVLRSVQPATPEARQASLVDDPPVARWVADALARRARVALTAGSARQKVPDGEVGHGSPFGNALVNALRPPAAGGRLAADFNTDGCVSNVELTAYVEGFGRTAYNSPRSGTLEGDDAGTIVLCQTAYATAPSGGHAGGTRFRAPTQHPRPPEGFVSIQPGDFLMGSPSDEQGHNADEAPRHQVTLSRALWVSAHEVTQAEWTRLMHTAPAYAAGCDTCPVERINWFDAVTYANARSQDEGLPRCYRLRQCDTVTGAGCAKGSKRCTGTRCAVVEFAGLDCPGYRLPTEAEWEYLTRADTTTAYSSGPRKADLARTDWYTHNAGGRSQPVGGKAANRWGIFDAHGNVREWCHDRFGEYAVPAATDPTGPATGHARVIRGGAFILGEHWARSAARSPRLPWVRDYHVGFRLVRTAPMR